MNMKRTLQQLEDDINSCGDDMSYVEWQKPNKSMIDFALRVARMLPKELPVPVAMVSDTGQIGFYWSTPLVYADIELEPGDVMSVYVRLHSYDTIDNTPDNKDIRIGGSTHFAEDVKTQDGLNDALRPLFGVMA